MKLLENYGHVGSRRRGLKKMKDHFICIMTHDRVSSSKFKYDKKYMNKINTPLKINEGGI